LNKGTKAKSERSLKRSKYRAMKDASLMLCMYCWYLVCSMLTSNGNSRYLSMKVWHRY